MGWVSVSVVSWGSHIGAAMVVATMAPINLRILYPISKSQRKRASRNHDLSHPCLCGAWPRTHAERFLAQLKGSGAMWSHHHRGQ